MSVAEKKPLDLYQQNAAGSVVDQGQAADQDYAEDVSNDNYDFQDDLDQDNEDLDDMCPAPTDAERERTQNDILFAIQGVGQIKTLNNNEVYVKNAHCEVSLKDIFKELNRDHSVHPIVRLTLGEWKFLQNDLMPLLIFHKKDKKLSYLTVKLMVMMTEYPQLGDAPQGSIKQVNWTHPKSAYRHKMIETLRAYKEAFLQPQVVAVLMEHLADCIGAEEKTQKHEDMIELIICLFKQLLQIPDPKVGQQATDFANKDLQKKLLIVYSEACVLDSFNYLSQEFTTPLQKRLCMQILEIQYQIFKNFTPQQIFMSKDKEKEARVELYAKEAQRERTRNFLRHTRPSKFGTQLCVQRPDGSRIMLNNIYQKSIDVTNLGKKQRQKSNALVGKKAKQNTIESNKSIVDEATLDDTDRKLIKIVKNYLIDMLDNCYNALINEIFVQIMRNQNPGGVQQKEEFFDKYHFFKLSSFMIQIQRMKAYEEHNILKKAAYEKAKQEQGKSAGNDGGKSLFQTGVPKGGRSLGSKAKSGQPKIQVPNVPFEINISLIGASLQLQNFEFLYDQLYKKIKNSKDHPVTDKEFHAAMQLLVQFLYIIRDMASSSDEKNQRNAKILSTNVFYNDLCIVSQYSLINFDPKKHNPSFLHDSVEFTHLMLEMLDEYSRGKVLTIQTQRKRKIKRAKKKKRVQRNADLDVDNGQEGQIEEFANDDYEEDEEMEDYEDEEQNIERQFNFVGELSVLVDYEVIDKYIYILRHEDQYSKNPFLIQACTAFFKRIIAQTKQTWIFFQIQTLSILSEFQTKDQTNNSLMKGINEKVAISQNERILKGNTLELNQIINQITTKFIELLKKNKMLGVEILFRFPSREIKDQILLNYERGVQGSQAPNAPYKKKQTENQSEDEGLVDLDNFDNVGNSLNVENLLNAGDEAQQSSTGENNEEAGFQWTQDKDEILITQYRQFESLGSRSCFELLSSLIPGTTAKECFKRGKELKLKKSTDEEARNISRKLISEASHSLTDKKVAIALEKFILAKLDKSQNLQKHQVKTYLDYIKNISNEYKDFRKKEDELILFGEQLVLDDIKRVVQKEQGQNGNLSASYMQTPFVIVPVSRNDFQKLSDPVFLNLLACFGVNVNLAGQVYPRVDSTVQNEHFEQTLNLMYQAMYKLFQDDLEGPVSRDLFQQEQTNIDE